MEGDLTVLWASRPRDLTGLWSMLWAELSLFRRLRAWGLSPRLPTKDLGSWLVARGLLPPSRPATTPLRSPPLPASDPAGVARAPSAARLIGHPSGGAVSYPPPGCRASGPAWPGVHGWCCPRRTRLCLCGRCDVACGTPLGSAPAMGPGIWAGVWGASGKGVQLLQWGGPRTGTQGLERPYRLVVRWGGSVYGGMASAAC